MKKIVSLTLLAAVITVLALTNPSQADFVDYVSERATEALMKKTGLSSGLTRFGVDALLPKEKNYAGLYDRSNFLICSIHKVNADFVNLEYLGMEDEEEVKFLGIAGQLLPLNLREKK